MNPRADNCPECNASWMGAEIPPAQRSFYEDSHTHFHRLIGIELPYDHPDHYDGVSYWQCPDCKATWNRWTGKREDIK